MAETNSEQLAQLLDNNDEVVSALSRHNMVDLFQKMLKKFIVCDKKKTLFYSFDHGRLDPKLLAKYLLRLVSERVKNNEAVWEKFLNFLEQIEERKISGKLKKISTSMEGQSACRSREDDDVILSCDDVSLLVNLMATVTQKYDKIGLALNLPMYKIEQCEGTSLAMKLGQILTCWISEDKHTPPSTTLSKLKNALKGELVAEYQLAIDLEKKFIKTRKGEHHSPATEQSDSNPLFEILEQSIDTEVEDGKSTLLYVLASHRESVCYQWYKNGQPLTNNSTYSGVDEDILVISPVVQGTEGEYTCCVSLQDKQIISNEINLQVIYSQEKKRLLGLYSVQGEVPKDSWPPMGTDTFIQLVLLEQQQNPSKQYSNSSDKRNNKKTERKGTDKDVEYEDMFGYYKSETLIIIEGRPGSGKTTLVHKLVKDWCNGIALKNAKLVFLITLRSLNETFRGSLPPIFEYLQGFIQECKEKGDSGEGACIILDGLDEFKSKNETSVIYSLINKTCLPQAMIIVSSRPTFVNAAIKRSLKNIVTLQTLGFSREQIIKYIKSFPFYDSSESESNSFSSNLEKYLNNHPMIFDLCYLPVHTAMICYLYKHNQGNIPKTQTKIYEEFTLCMILRDLKRQSNEASFISLSEIKGNLKNNFDVLCKLAFTMTCKDVQIITRKELDSLLNDAEDKRQKCFFGLLTVQQIYGLGQDNQYTFLHLTFQEFLAAYYIASLTKEEQLTVIEKSIDFSSAVWIFLCGLIDLQANEDLLIKMERYLTDDMLVCLTCAFESQQKFTCDKIMGYFNEELSFPSKVSSLDLACVKYVTSNTTKTFTILDMPKTDTIALIQNIHEKHFEHLVKLECNEELSEKKDLMTLGRILELCSQLKEADLRFKNISNVSARYISESFGNKLSHINLSCISCSEGIQILLSGLKSSKGVNLCLTFKKLCQLGISEVVAVLKSEILSHIHLNYLEISECHISDDNAAEVRDALQNCFALATLEISHSCVNSENTETIISSLHCLTFIMKLNLSHQQMDDKGAVTLAATIEDLLLVESLELCNNNIGTVGATAILKKLPNLTTLEDIDLSHNNIGPFDTRKRFKMSDFPNDKQTRLKIIDLSHNNIDCIEADTLMVVLNCCTNLQTIDLSNNNISDDGAAAIGTELNSLLKLKKINLSKNSIGPAGAERIAKGFKNFPQLTNLDLSNNSIGSDGANAISGEFEHLSELSLLDLSNNNIEYVDINMKKGLTQLTSLRRLELSGNCIEINSAIRVIQALKCCDHLRYADLSREECGDFDTEHPWISIQGIVSEEDESVIAALEAAVQHRSSTRTLDLGFTSKEVKADEQ